MSLLHALCCRLGSAMAHVQIPLDLSPLTLCPPLMKITCRLDQCQIKILGLPHLFFFFSFFKTYSGNESEAGNVIKEDKDFSTNAQKRRRQRASGLLLLMQHPEDKLHICPPPPSPNPRDFFIISLSLDI